MTARYIKSPYKEMGVKSQARQPAIVRRPTIALTISKKEAKNAGTGHIWTVEFSKGDFIERCRKCGKPAFAVELDRCGGKRG